MLHQMPHLSPLFQLSLSLSLQTLFENGELLLSTYSSPSLSAPSGAGPESEAWSEPSRAQLRNSRKFKDASTPP